MENNFAPAVIKALKVGDRKIELSENSQGKPVARHFRLLSAGKNKGQYQWVEGIYFPTEEKRAAWVSKKIAGFKADIKSKEDAKSAKKAARADMKHGFEVGQIFYDSWGYDQTNVDWYKIIEVKEKSVVIQEIGCNRVEGSGYHDSWMEVPNPDQVFGEKMLKIIKVSVNGDGKVSYRFNGKYSFSGAVMPYNKGEKGVYASTGH